MAYDVRGAADGTQTRRDYRRDFPGSRPRSGRLARTRLAICRAAWNVEQEPHGPEARRDERGAPSDHEVRDEGDGYCVAVHESGRSRVHDERRPARYVQCAVWL